MYNRKDKLPVEAFSPLGKDEGWRTENTKKKQAKPSSSTGLQVFNLLIAGG